MKYIVIIPKRLRKRRIFSRISKKSSSLRARVRLIFKGPHSDIVPQPEQRAETKYKHEPKHSASSFVKTTTTAVMIEPVVDQSDDITLAETGTVYIPSAPEHNPPAVEVV